MRWTRLTPDEVRRLIDRLPEADVEQGGEYLRRTLDPLQIALALVPDGDEPDSPEEAEAARRAREEIGRGQGIPHDEIVRGHVG